MKSKSNFSFFAGKNGQALKEEASATRSEDN